MENIELEQENKESKGPVIGTVIIIIILILGAFYFLTREPESTEPMVDSGMPVPGEEVDEMIVNEAEPTPAEIEAELEAELEAMNAELDLLGAELAE